MDTPPNVDCSAPGRRPGSSIAFSGQLSRRDFLKRAVVGTTGLAAGAGAVPTRAATASAAARGARPLPRWRGFNLTNFFQAFSRGEQGQGMVSEDDLRWIRDWGFDFVRLPMDYWFWVDADWRTTRKLNPDDVFKIKEAALEKVDRAVELCGRRGLHLSLNFHRGPGYCINNPGREPFVLWTDPRAEEAFVHHWGVFARRYAGVAPEKLSFNLLNEAPRPRPGYMSRADYVRVMTRATRKIREHAPRHTIIVDGLSVGTEVIPELVSTGVAQSVHAYWPAGISHYHAPWVDKKLSFPTPTWPLKGRDGGIQADRRKLEARYAPWGRLVRDGVGVHCGECGCYNQTPYPVFIAWFTDVLDILTGHGIGYALWNFRGSFGLLDSGRKDVAYQDWHGHRLDANLLKLLQAH